MEGRQYQSVDRVMFGDSQGDIENREMWRELVKETLNGTCPNDPCGIWDEVNGVL